jgi:hypothetical protein
MRLILPLLLTVPIPAIALADLLNGELGQPLDDYLFLYAVALIALAPAAALTTACFVLRGFGTPRLHDLIVYTFFAAAGSAAFMTVLDAWDDYFSRPGIGWVWPISGFVLGLMFGTAFRGVGALIEKRSADEFRDG